jgi:pimeloyl-ACP methyl ester carboxylesterase
VPLCLIISNSDKLTGEAISEKWRDLLPDSLVIEITSPVGHYPPLEDPDQVISSYFNILTNI